jgi:hypothetical protein
MTSRLTELRDREGDSALRGSYRAAIDRLGALAYRLRVKPEKRVVGLPLKQTAPPPAPEPPQRTLPLGPVPRRTYSSSTTRTSTIEPVPLQCGHGLQFGHGRTRAFTGRPVSAPPKCHEAR